MKLHMTSKQSFFRMSVWIKKYCLASLFFIARFLMQIQTKRACIQTILQVSWAFAFLAAIALVPFHPVREDPLHTDTRKMRSDDDPIKKLAP